MSLGLRQLAKGDVRALDRKYPPATDTGHADGEAGHLGGNGADPGGVGSVAVFGRHRLVYTAWELGENRRRPGGRCQTDRHARKTNTSFRRETVRPTNTSCV